LNFVKYIFKTQLFQISSLNSLSILVRIAGGLLASKMIALFIGPSGMALTGNLRNFLTSVDAFTTLGLQNGIIKYTAENENDEVQLQRTLATVCISVLVAILLCGVVLFLPAPYWSSLIFNGNEQFSWVFRLLALVLPLYTGSFIFLAILNGLGKYKQVIYLNIWGNALGVLMSAAFIWQYGLYGAFMGIVLSPIIVFFISVYYLWKRFPGLRFCNPAYFDIQILKGLFSYSLMSLITALLGPIIYISIRNQIVHNVNVSEAGYWEAVNRISTFYLLFASTLLTVYFLPKLSVAKADAETKTVFLNYFKSVVPLYAMGLLTVYVLRGFIVQTLFSKEFLPMENLFVWQLAGDFFKVCSLILGYEFFAKKMTRQFIITEVISFVVLYTSSRFFIELYGSEGAVMAHAFTYMIYFVTLIIYFRKKLF
jgi:O-antigen/teichoic acid export membrane protein